ncbi:hypothetical protein SLA2020_380500 [Shorea laevis]|jgi:hypothetical protein
MQQSNYCAKAVACWAGYELKNRTATAEERSELVLEEAIADKRAQRAVQLSGKICDLFERAYRKDRYMYIAHTD